MHPRTIISTSITAVLTAVGFHFVGPGVTILFIGPIAVVAVGAGRVMEWVCRWEPRQPELSHEEKLLQLQQSESELEAWHMRFDSVCDLKFETVHEDDVAYTDANAPRAVAWADDLADTPSSDSCAVCGGGMQLITENHPDGSTTTEYKCGDCGWETPPQFHPAPKPNPLVTQVSTDHCRQCSMRLLTRESREVGICATCRKQNAKTELERKMQMGSIYAHDGFVDLKDGGRFLRMTKEAWISAGRPTAEQMLGKIHYRCTECGWRSVQPKCLNCNHAAEHADDMSPFTMPRMVERR